MRQWMISFMLFMAVFLGCVATLFMPITVTTELGVKDSFAGLQLEEQRIDGVTLTYTDITAMGDNWVNNPKYFIIIGITMSLSIVGAWWSLRNAKEKEYEEGYN